MLLPHVQTLPAVAPVFRAGTLPPESLPLLRRWRDRKEDTVPECRKPPGTETRCPAPGRASGGWEGETYSIRSSTKPGNLRPERGSQTSALGQLHHTHAPR